MPALAATAAILMLSAGIFANGIAASAEKGHNSVLDALRAQASNRLTAHLQTPNNALSDNNSLSEGSLPANPLGSVPKHQGIDAAERVAADNAGDGSFINIQRNKSGLRLTRSQLRQYQRSQNAIDRWRSSVRNTHTEVNDLKNRLQGIAPYFPYSDRASVFLGASSIGQVFGTIHTYGDISRIINLSPENTMRFHERQSWQRSTLSNQKFIFGDAWKAGLSGRVGW